MRRLGIITKSEEFFDLSNVKDFFTKRTGFISDGEFDQRVQEFKKAGLEFGTQGTLFRIIVTGEYKLATYNLTAIVALPAKPEPPEPKNNKKNPQENPQKNPNDPDEQGDEQEDAFNGPDAEKNKNKKNKKRPLELLAPRVVELVAD